MKPYYLKIGNILKKIYKLKTNNLNSLILMFMKMKTKGKDYQNIYQKEINNLLMDQKRPTN
jgi:hypothetical protein